MEKFKPGATVVFDPSGFNQDYWNGLTIDQKKKYYGDLHDFDRPKEPILFTFLCYHYPQVEHCVLINMQNQRVETMRHTCDFRLATEDEC